MNNLKIAFLKDVSFEQFKIFLDSLTVEKESWSLDLQGFKNPKDFYDKITYQSFYPCLLILHENKIVSFINGYSRIVRGKRNLVEISFVVKKEYQRNGLGTKMLIELEKILSKTEHYTQMCGKHFKDNIGSHKAFLKAGYSEAVWESDGVVDNMIWKLKDIK